MSSWSQNLQNQVKSLDTNLIDEIKNRMEQLKGQNVNAMLQYIEENMSSNEIQEICETHMAIKEVSQSPDFTIEHFANTEFEAEKKVVEEFLTNPKNYDENAFQAYLDLLSELQIFQNSD